MTNRVLFSLCLLLCLTTLSHADLFLSEPIVARNKTNVVEVGASPQINISYKNTGPQEVSVTGIDLWLAYDPEVIDAVIDFTHDNPDIFAIESYDTSVPGKIFFRLRVPPDKKTALKLAHNKSNQVATLTFHVNQQAKASIYARLFNWSAATEEVSGVFESDSNVTGALLTPAVIYLEKSKPPDFSGLNKLIGSGNTLLLDWRAAAGKDRTLYYNGKLNYTVYRKTKDADWEALSSRTESSDINQNPSARVPYTGNSNFEHTYEDKQLSDGTVYFYRVTASDDTSPTPNEQTNTAVLSEVLVDLAPPPEVSNIKVEPSDNFLTLKWKIPEDEDLGSLVIVKNKGEPPASGSLGGAQAVYPYNNGPEYYVEDQPFGNGKGKVVFAGSSGYAPDEFVDYDALNGEINYYRIYTFDQVQDGEPRQMGRNYSKGILASGEAGIAPLPVTNFTVEKGELPDEVLLTWNNSMDQFCAGTLIRYATDDKKYSGVVAAFPMLGSPGEKDGYFVGGFQSGKAYHFTAVAYNGTDQEFDPASESNIAAHRFSPSASADYFIALIEGEEASEEAASAEAAAAAEKTSQVNLWIDDRLYQQSLVDRGITFHVAAKPKIKVELAVSEPQTLNASPADYSISVDEKVYSFGSYGTASIKKNTAVFELSLPEKLSSGTHTLTFNFKGQNGVKAMGGRPRNSAVITASSGPLNLSSPPLSFPSPFDPARHGRVTFQYTLSDDAAIDIVIMNSQGQAIKKILLAKGEEGGKGQLNKVTWDGTTDMGAKISNGLYIVMIFSRDDKKLLGKIKLTVYQ